MNEKSLAKLFSVIFISFWLFSFSGPAYAGDFDGTLFLAFSLFVYPPLFLVSLIFHIRFILRGVYQKRDNLIAALVVIDVLALMGIFPASIFMEGSVFITTCFICFWGALVVIPLYQYWHHTKDVDSSSDWKASFKWMVWGTVLFYFVIAVFLFWPIVGQHRTEHRTEQFNRQREISRQKHDENSAKEKQEREQGVLEKRQQSETQRSQRQERRVQERQEHCARLLETILNNQQAEVVKLKTMTSEQVKQQVDSGQPPRSVDGYFVDWSREIENSKIEELKTLLRDPTLYRFEDTGVINPFIKDSQQVYAVLFGDGQLSARILFFADKNQITIIDSFDVVSVKLKEDNKLKQFFSEK